jgi:hypothetical protein
MWITLFSIITIIIAWAGMTIYPNHLEIQSIEFDVGEIRKIFTDACTDIIYLNTYNPRTNQGIFTINNTYFSIQGTRYTLNASIFCDVSLNQEIILDDIIYIRFNKTTSFEVLGVS